MSEKSLTSYHAAIQFQGYMFEKLSFSYHGNNGNEDEGEAVGSVSTKFRIATALNKENDSTLKGDIRLSCEVNAENNEQFPMVSATMHGEFHISPNTPEDQAKKLLEVNGVAVMFPFLRAAISNITMTAGVGPMVLPLVDVRKLAHAE